MQWILVQWISQWGQTHIVLPIIGFSLVVLQAFNCAVSVTVDGPSLEYFAILNITLRFVYIYSQFLFEVMFYKIITNTDLMNTEPLFLWEI